MWERVRELWLRRSSVVRRGRGEGGRVRPLLLHVTWLAWVGRRGEEEVEKEDEEKEVPGRHSAGDRQSPGSSWTAG